jgi:hypothetical protein
MLRALQAAGDMGSLIRTFRIQLGGALEFDLGGILST